MLNNTAVITLEFRFFRTMDNNFYTDSIFGREFFGRYLNTFEKLIIVARALNVDQIDPSWSQVDSDKISFYMLPHYIGPRQMLVNLRKINKTLKNVADLPCTFILRVPGFISMLLYKKLLKNGKVYALEVVGDPFDVFKPENFRSKFAHLYQFFFSRELKLQCLKALAVSYVTKETLQKSYPSKSSAISSYYSSVELPDYFFSKNERRYNNEQKINLLFVGSLSQKYKGLHILLEALVEVKKVTKNWSLKVVGDGCYLQYYEALSKELDIVDKVIFCGNQSNRKTMFEYYCSADIFVLPSLTEGLPRVVIEAMATGLPVIASAVGGVPELVEGCALVKSGNVQQLRDKLIEFMSEPEILMQRSIVNRVESESYRSSKLQLRRDVFFKEIISSQL
jgi:glycosyltransferase involved in cell wall biosynthesis